VSIFKASAIIFDLDGVLANSISVVEEAWGIWSAEKGLDFARVLQVAHGRRKPEILEIVAPHLDPAPEIERLMQLEADRIAAVRPIPGAAKFVASLPPGRWAIATSGERRGAIARLKQVGIPVPQVLIASEDVERGKPNPKIYLKAAAGLAIAPENCVVFEDAPAGIEAARAAGMTAIAVLTTYPVSAFHVDIAKIPNFEEVNLSMEIHVK
jgi:sugar-phosphatase